MEQTVSARISGRDLTLWVERSILLRDVDFQDGRKCKNGNIGTACAEHKITAIDEDGVELDPLDPVWPKAERLAKKFDKDSIVCDDKNCSCHENS